MHKRIDRPYGDGFDVSGRLPYSPQFLNAAVDRFYAISVTDYSGAATGDSSGGFLSRSDEFYVTELLTKLWGKHQVKAGGEFRRYLDESGNAFRGCPSGRSPSTATSHRPRRRRRTPRRRPAATRSRRSCSDIRPSTRPTSLPAVRRPRINAPATHWRGNYYAGFLQDDWRVTSAWTLNLGMRWDYEAPVSERENLTNFGFDQTAPSPCRWQVCRRCAVACCSAPVRSFSRDPNNSVPASARPTGSARTWSCGRLRPDLPALITDRGQISGSRRDAGALVADAGRTPYATLTNPFPDRHPSPSDRRRAWVPRWARTSATTCTTAEIPRYHSTRWASSRAAVAQRCRCVVCR